MSEASHKHSKQRSIAVPLRGAEGEVALERLWALAAGLTVGSGLFGWINILKLQGPERLSITSCNFTLCLVFLVLWWSLIRRRVHARWADPLAAGALLLAFSNVLLTLALISEPLQNNLAAIYIIATGYFLHSKRWLAGTIGLMLTAWAPIAWHVVSSPGELVQFALTLLAASLLSIAVYIGRQRSFRRLRKSEERYRQLFQQSKDAVAISTPDGRLLDINNAGLELFGYESQEDIADFDVARDAYLNPQDREEMVAELLDKGFVQDFETRLKTREGELLTVEGTTSTLQDTKGQTVAFLAIMRDITTRKREQQELTRHRERLEELVAERTGLLEQEIAERQKTEQERLQLERQFHESQKLESLGVLAGGIAHDFNNLLVGMMGNASLMRRELPRDSPHRKGLAQIEVAARRAAELADQMLAYAGQAQFMFETCDLGQIVDEVTNLLRTSVSKKAVLDINFAEDLPAIQADMTQIRQVVMNLIINASDALMGESGTISVRTHTVDITDDARAEAALTSGRYVCLEITDSGCGMDETTRAKIFDPFFSTKFDGRGLGLAAVSGIVRGHQGAIQVESSPGSGSTFRILVPASDDPAECREGDQREPATWKALAGVALLVDDEEVVRLVARAILEHGGLEVLVATDGHQAVEIFTARADEIDLVVLDSKMPKMDGAQTFRELRRLKPDVKVILCSGDPEKMARRGIDGLAGFVRKPYDATTLLHKVGEVLEGPTPKGTVAQTGRPATNHSLS